MLQALHDVLERFLQRLKGSVVPELRMCGGANRIKVRWSRKPAAFAWNFDQLIKRQHVIGIVPNEHFEMRTGFAPRSSAHLNPLLASAHAPCVVARILGRESHWSQIPA